MTAEVLKKQYNLNAKSSGKAPRQSNLELLRIISMLLIIMHHYTIHGGFDYSGDLTFNMLFVQFISLGGKVGVDIFIFITGYFMINSKFNPKRMIKLELQILFYAVGFMILFCGTGLSVFNLQTALNNILPVISGYYWFVTSYVVFYLCIPALNALIYAIDRKKHLAFIVVGLLIWCVIPTFYDSHIDSSYIIWFSIIYLIVSYDRLYPSRFTENGRLNLIIGICTYLFMFLMVLISDLTELNQAEVLSYLYDARVLPVFICSFTLFLGFKNLKLKHSKIINRLASSTFGVYLIHENIFFRTFLWERCIIPGRFINSKYLPFHMLISVIGIFVIGTVIDQLRIVVLEKPLWKIIEPKLDKIGERIKKKLSPLLEKI